MEHMMVIINEGSCHWTSWLKHKISDFYSEGTLFISWLGHQLFWLKIFQFLQSPQGSIRIIVWNRPWHLPHQSFQVQWVLSSSNIIQYYMISAVYLFVVSLKNLQSIHKDSCFIIWSYISVPIVHYVLILSSVIQKRSFFGPWSLNLWRSFHAFVHACLFPMSKILYTSIQFHCRNTVALKCNFWSIKLRWVKMETQNHFKQWPLIQERNRASSTAHSIYQPLLLLVRK